MTVRIVAFGLLVFSPLLIPRNAQTQGDRHSETQRRAVQTMPEGIENKHSSARTWFVRGIGEADPNKKLLCYTKALLYDYRYYAAYYNRALTYSQIGEHELALADYDQALALNPNNADVLVNRGSVYALIGEYERALVDYDNALAISKIINDLDVSLAVSLRINRGNAYFYLGKYESALNEYSKALELNPNSSEPYLNRGRAYHYSGRNDLALRDYVRAIELAPNDFVIHNNFAWILIDSQMDLDQGVRYAKRALELKPDSGSVMDTLGWGYFKKGEYETAVDWLQRALERDPENEGFAVHLQEARAALDSYPTQSPRTRSPVNAR